MNNSYEIKNEQVIITDEKNNKRKRPLNPNIKEILEKENIIEVLNKIIREKENEIKQNNERSQEDKKSFLRNFEISCTVFISCLILDFCVLNTMFEIPTIIALTPFLASSTLAIPISIFTYLGEKREIKRNKMKSAKQLVAATQRKEYETNKLNELLQEKLSRNMDITSTKEILHPNTTSWLTEKEIETYASLRKILLKKLKEEQLTEYFNKNFNVYDQDAIKMYKELLLEESMDTFKEKVRAKIK